MPKSILSKLVWLAIAVTGAAAIGGIALHRGETINALWFIAAAICTYLIGYRFYSAWICTKVLVLDESRATPAERSTTAATSYRPTNGWSSAIISPPSPALAR